MNRVGVTGVQTTKRDGLGAEEASLIWGWVLSREGWAGAWPGEGGWSTRPKGRCTGDKGQEGLGGRGQPEGRLPSAGRLVAWEGGGTSVRDPGRPGVGLRNSAGLSLG